MSARVTSRSLRKQAEESRRTYVSMLSPLAAAPTAPTTLPRAGSGTRCPPSAGDVKTAVRQAAEAWTRSLGNRAMLAWLVVGIVVWGWSWLAGVQGKDLLALALALAVVTVCLGILWIWRRDDGGFLSPLRAADGRLSTSYTQGGLWTVLVAFAFALFATRLAFGTLGPTEFEAAAQSFVPTYLLLLGGPFAAAALAGLNYGIRKDDGSIQKTEAYGAQLRDIVADDSGRTNLNDSQFLVFNVVAAATFVVLFARDAAKLPVLPSTLVGLTSLSAMAYVTTKAVSNQRPVISSIVVATVGGSTMSASISVDTWVDVRGSNFVVPGAAEVEDLAQVRVRFGTVEVGVEGTRPDGRSNPTASSVLVKIPTLPAGTASVDVKVITAAGVESNIYPLSLT